MAGVELEGGGLAEAALHDDERGDDLPRDGRDGGARDAHLGEDPDAEDEKRIEHDVDGGARNLREHGHLHVADRL